MVGRGDVGRTFAPTSSALRPRAEDELAHYRLGSRLRGARVLDIGSGDGRLALGAARAGAREVVGVDPDTSAVRAARRQARTALARNVSFRLAAAQLLPFHGGAFDLALLSWVL